MCRSMRSRAADLAQGLVFEAAMNGLAEVVFQGFEPSREGVPQRQGRLLPQVAMGVPAIARDDHVEPIEPDQVSGMV